MQGFRNYSLEAMQREQLHCVDLMPPQYGKSTPPLSPNSGEFPPTGSDRKKTRNCVNLSLRDDNDNLSENMWRSVA